MKLKRIYIILAFLLFVAVSSGASAWDYNYSYREPPTPRAGGGGNNNDCKWTYNQCKNTCASQTSCSIDNRTDTLCVTRSITSTYNWVKNKGKSNEKTKTCKRWQQNFYTKTKTGNSQVYGEDSRYCHRYSCYYHAVSFIEAAPTPIQPLTDNFQTIKTVISGNGSSSAASTSSGLQASKLQIKIGAYDNKSPRFSNQSADAFKDTGLRPDVGAGTSAMQGLLWAWRSLSDNWRGVWRTVSDYENDGEEAAKRHSLPSNENSKYIILISDGADTDGPSYLGNTSGAKLGADGIGSIIPNNAKVPFESCDAHKPIGSITYDNYVAVCNQLADQEIQVHAILYGYSGGTKNPLKKCAELTKGSYQENISTADIRETIKTIITSLSQSQIRLIK